MITSRWWQLLWTEHLHRSEHLQAKALLEHARTLNPKSKKGETLRPWNSTRPWTYKPPSHHTGFRLFDTNSSLPEKIHDQAGYPPTTPSPPWRTSSKVHQRRSSQRFEIRLMGNMFVVSTNDGTVKTPKKKAIWIVDFQWIGRKAVNVSIVSIDNQRNHCLANLILNGQVQRENCPFLLHKSTLPFRVEGMKGWKSWTVLENHLAMATKRPAELTMFDYHPFSQLFSEFVWSGKWFDSTIYENTVRWFGSSTRGRKEHHDMSQQWISEAFVMSSLFDFHWFLRPSKIEHGSTVTRVHGVSHLC